jgi:hypothetical protein
MASGVTGNFAGLEKLKASLQKTLGVPQKAAIRFAPVLAGFLRQEFATGTDPWGDPWKPLKGVTLRKGRHPPPLTASGSAASSLTVTAAGVKDRASLAEYLRYHLTSRPVLPLRGDTWPAKWLEAVKVQAAAALRELAGGKP